jgi:hypothetical protein
MQGGGYTAGRWARTSVAIVEDWPGGTAGRGTPLLINVRDVWVEKRFIAHGDKGEGLPCTCN